ncbi:hypothetical protein V8E53_011186 [Lactarius tabidus]
MHVKCLDCLGANYFCRICCIKSHKCTPFHRLARWTGTHFTPISLHSLGFVVFLGHHGDPCPLTVEAFIEEQASQPEQPHDALPSGGDSGNMQGISTTLFEPLLDHFTKSSHRTRTAKSGNPLLTAVHQSGIFALEVLYCICPNAVETHEQLFNAGLFPSSFKQIETVFTFTVLDDFLADNLECKTTAQQYYSKLQSITNRMFPDSVPNLYKQLLRASRQWRDIWNRMNSGFGHEGGLSEDGTMAIFCPACPQPGVNLPDDWRTRYTPTQLIRTFIMDGNFSAEHMKCRSGEQDTPLSSGMAFMTSPDPYIKHLNSGKEITQVSTCNTYKAIELANSSRPHLDVTGIGATACCHGFFVPTSVVDFQKGERQINMDYSLCKALSYNMESIPVALVMYDIMCQYKVHLKERVERSPELSIPDSLELRTGIGLFHIHGHQDSCLPRFSPSYIPGAKQVDGEIIETLWAPLNNISRSIRGMSLPHCQEVLDAHMNHSNWKKMVRIVPSLLTRWKRLQAGLESSAEAFQSLSLRLEKHTSKWLTQDQQAQIDRNVDPSAMDMYDTATAKGPSLSEVQWKLITGEGGDPSECGQTSWIASGIRIQELQLALRYELRIYGAKHTSEETQAIHNRQGRIQKLIDRFEHQADGFILHQLNMDIPNLSAIDDYNGSGIDHLNPEDLPIPLPSSVGWDWCVTHHSTSLAAKEAQLRVAQANDSIHKIRLALGYKSAIFRTQVRSAKSQQKKTRAWNAVKSVETTVHENARIYSMARNAYWTLRQAYPTGPDLPQLLPNDLHIATLVLGSEQTGQQDNGTWMDDFERVHWLRAKAQFERWLEEQDSIHNEACWIPSYFHSKAESWRVLKGIAAQGFLKGHEAYASYQMHAWEELSLSSANSLSPITSSIMHHYDAESIFLY